jgi:hypothetical protein
VGPQAEVDVADLASQIRPVDLVLLVFDDLVAERSEGLSYMRFSAVTRLEVAQIRETH